MAVFAAPRQRESRRRAKDRRRSGASARESFRGGGLGRESALPSPRADADARPPPPPPPPPPLIGQPRSSLSWSPAGRRSLRSGKDLRRVGAASACPCVRRSFSSRELARQCARASGPRRRNPSAAQELIPLAQQPRRVSASRRPIPRSFHGLAPALRSRARRRAAVATRGPGVLAGEERPFWSHDLARRAVGATDTISSAARLGLALSCEHAWHLSSLIRGQAQRASTRVAECERVWLRSN